MMPKYLDFEKPIIGLKEKIEELKTLNTDRGGGLEDEIEKLKVRLSKVREEIFSNLTSWEQVELARHPNRPYTNDYIKYIFKDWVELHGDRRFADDPSIVAGIGKLNGISFVVVGHEKGRKTKEKIRRNFGMPHPEGYRKALRVMKLGGKFKLPIVTFIDTPGAYPGIGAEERGQALAIAENIKEIAMIPVPIIVVITGEGGSGGALAIGIGDRIYMQKYAVYSVISPEGCASIIWRDQKYKKEATEALKITAKDLKKFNIIDDIIMEPGGGAHSNHKEAANLVGEAIMKAYNELKDIPADELIQKRGEKFSKMGFFKEL
ncbi:MAG: acetyl-CoA carboxylase carboxyltransferase subunit alpha [candidate division WOR-3 bacterium]|nr:acetyl-CoA carboxylase carboxyltransferase subunit alpha [candidate division WOR-3 bacterium]